KSSESIQTPSPTPVLSIGSPGMTNLVLNPSSGLIIVLPLACIPRMLLNTSRVLFGLYQYGSPHVYFTNDVIGRF
ncbi:hypothetical protein ACFLZA_03510, partial [Candidatus Neomarinimicrobiota bacterium]